MASDKELDTPDDIGNTEDLTPSDILDGWDELSRPPSVRSVPASLASRSAGPASRKSQTDVKPSPASCSAPDGEPSAGKGPAGQVAGDDGAAAAEESRPPAAGGWGGWGALTKLKASVQQVAATAVDDVTQLTTSFQQLVAEAVGPGGDSADEGAGVRPRSGGAREALTLDQSLYVYGGSQAREELQELGAECSRLGHRVCAAEQDPVRRAALEDALRTLAEALGSLDEGAGAGVGGAEAGGDAGARGSEELARDGAASTQPPGSRRAPPPRSAALERGHAVVRDVAEEAVESAESLGARADVLPAGTKHLAEVASLGMERTLSLARSVLHSARSARPSDDRISWPSEAPAVARVLRGEAACALRELGSVEAALLAALDRLRGDGGGEVAHDDDAERRELMRLAEECRAAMAACLALSTPLVWWSCCASRAGPAAEPR
ncbi:hypothetical protein F751_6243 [Auxenochlorella protothecoides]|uniref:Uncharacterized protein n=1 Tax=Auxenochlorella protothecoides TaxID=3075 RepID=A0A087SK38_AUXPR|nr:hypothetical protein F751_6243 [Auxenochlorella protothecoides]KFM26092.1 hypothetical protein F751_6243 [Auxenochlorella protothecoides]RMZ57217.1 hypothetical protein APUTEX25_004051 [Auxenochlorella protothecoides]|eukprot:RMZ57217.1 hypothetical protein APUTEX25_004051 [Auxenochlorella protothecoides]